MLERAIPLTIPISEPAVSSLSVGDTILLSGIIVTARDTAHRWLYDRFIANTVTPSAEDQVVYEQLRAYLAGGVIYHCGPVVRQDAAGYHVTAAGPTTSIREEPYQADIIRLFGLRGIIGKGGMGAKTLTALGVNSAVYFHAVGGTAAVIAEHIERVLAVRKPEFGMPEAMWVLQVRDVPLFVTMDAHGSSLHDTVREASQAKLRRLLQDD